MERLFLIAGPHRQDTRLCRNPFVGPRCWNTVAGLGHGNQMSFLAYRYDTIKTSDSRVSRSLTGLLACSLHLLQRRKKGTIKVKLGMHLLHFTLRFYSKLAFFAV